MRSWKSFMVVALVFGGASAAAVAGCATDVAGVTDEDSGAVADSATPPRDSAKQDSATATDTAPPPPTDSAPPRDTSPADTSPADTSTADTSTDARDAADAADAADASGPKPPGSPCAPVNAIHESPCGFCGKSSQLCLATGWSPAGACVGETPAGPNRCMPGGGPVQEDCGMCGKRTVTCQPNCTKAQGQCLGEPAGACAPGTKDFSAVGCPVAGEGRERTCLATCQYGPFGPCMPPATDVNVPAAVGVIAGLDLRFEAARSSLRLVTSFAGLRACPAAFDVDTTLHVYGRVKNNNATAATVSIWSSLPAGSMADSDTIMAIYAGATEPTTPAARMACVGGVSDDCTAPVGAPAGMCTAGGSGMVGANAIVIAPGATVTVYIGEYFDMTTPGPIRINVRTEAL